VRSLCHSRPPAARLSDGCPALVPGCAIDNPPHIRRLMPSSCCAAARPAPHHTTHPAPPLSGAWLTVRRRSGIQRRAQSCGGLQSLKTSVRATPSPRAVLNPPPLRSPLELPPSPNSNLSASCPDCIRQRPNPRAQIQLTRSVYTLGLTTLPLLRRLPWLVRFASRALPCVCSGHTCACGPCLPAARACRHRRAAPQ
jgi:hypothetical protein